MYRSQLTTNNYNYIEPVPIPNHIGNPAKPVPIPNHIGNPAKPVPLFYYNQFR
jgi:hypothetical protein